MSTISRKFRWSYFVLPVVLLIGAFTYGMNDALEGNKKSSRDLKGSENIVATSQDDRTVNIDADIDPAPGDESNAESIATFWNDVAFVPSDGTLRISGFQDGIYPDLPLDVYENQIDAANSGDTESMFKLYTVFRDCGRVPEGSFDDIRKGYAEREIGVLTIRQIDARMEQCIPLRNVVGGLPEQLFFWRQKLADAGHPVILANTELIRWIESGARNDQIGLDLVESVAIAAGTDTPSGYQLPVQYLATIFPREYWLERKAWSALACRASRGCDVSAFKRALDQKYAIHDVLTIEQLAIKYKTSIDSGRVESTLLPLPYAQHGQPEHLTER